MSRRAADRARAELCTLLDPPVGRQPFSQLCLGVHRPPPRDILSFSLLYAALRKSATGSRVAFRFPQCLAALGASVALEFVASGPLGSTLQSDATATGHLFRLSLLFVTGPTDRNSAHLGVFSLLILKLPCTAVLSALPDPERPYTGLTLGSGALKGQRKLLGLA